MAAKILTYLPGLAALLIAAVSSAELPGCQFPSQWEGQWFQSGLGIVTINGSVLNDNPCVESKGDKFVLEDKRDNCYKCMAIIQRHINVLQYKESICESRRSNLDDLCNNINADHQLFSMFRKDSNVGPVPCPFNSPPYQFTYNKGGGECGNPVSRIDACMDNSRLLLRNAACPDVASTQDVVEELVCLAVWKDGPYHYLVGKLNHAHISTDEDRYRCFVYESVNNVTIHVAQSGDASCAGTSTPREGAKVMTLTKTDLAHSHCHFPNWITHHRHWHSLNKVRQFTFNATNTTFKQEVKEDPTLTPMASTALLGAVPVPSFHTGTLAAGLAGDRHTHTEMSGVCHAVEKIQNHSKSSKKQFKVVVHLTSGCESGYVCMMFYQRDGHVIEVQQSTTHTPIPEEACKPNNFNPATLPFITLITSNLNTHECPHVGRYTVAGQLLQQRRKRKANAASNASSDPASGRVDNYADCQRNGFHSLIVGCKVNKNIMEFHSSCDTEEVSTYSCHGSWEENGTSYLIASPYSRKSTGAKRFCFIYTREHIPQAHAYNRRDGKRGPVAAASRSSILKLSTVAESCLRDISPGINGAWAFNLTDDGQCEAYDMQGTDSASVTTYSHILLVSLLILTTSINSLR